MTDRPPNCMIMNTNTFEATINDTLSNSDVKVIYAFDIGYIIPSATTLFDIAKVVVAHPESFNGTTELMAIIVLDIERALSPQLRQYIQEDAYERR